MFTRLYNLHIGLELASKLVAESDAVFPTAKLKHKGTSFLCLKVHESHSNVWNVLIIWRRKPAF